MQIVPSIIYRSPRLLVKAAHRGSRCCFVTFDSYTDTPDLDRDAFGEKVFAQHAISAVHVVSARNSWYHEPDWCEAITAARSQAAHYSRVVTYGSSMGGYAALRFADHLAATAALVLSPQYSHDPRKAPFETRWPEHRRHHWRPELAGPLPGNVPAVIVYDPMMQAERLHVERIAAEMQIDPLPLPYAGHVSAAFLAECGLLSEIVLAIADGDIDLAGFRRRARAGRKQSLHYLIALSDAAHKQGRARVALDLAHLATDLAPQRDLAWHYLGHLSSRLGRHSDSVAAHRTASELAPHSGAIQMEYALAQRRVGDHAGALRTLRQLAGKALPAKARRRIGSEIWMSHALYLAALARGAFGLPRR